MKEVNNTEQLILQAAEAEFLEKGYNKARTTEIAKRAGLNHAMLHYYFRTKEKLFYVIFKKKSELMANVLLLSFKNELPFLDKMRKAVEDHFDFIAANSELPRFIFSELLSNTTLRNLFIHTIKEKALVIIDDLKKEMEHEAIMGTIRPINPYDLIITTVSLNVFIFLTSPAISEIMSFQNGQLGKFMQHRKTTNCNIILSLLKP